MLEEVPMIRQFAGSVAVAIALSGCASLNENECVTVDWQSIGYQDGAMGRPAAYSSQHRKACAKHGVTLDQYAYLQGRDQGLRTYCRPSKGFNFGANGVGYAGVCPADLEGPFLAEYRKGWRLYELEGAVSSSYSALEAKKKYLHEVNHTLTEKEAAVLAAGLTVDERAKLVLEIKDLIIERGQLKKDIVTLEHEYAARYEELEIYRASLNGPYLSAATP